MKTTGVLPEAFAAAICRFSRSDEASVSVAKRCDAGSLVEAVR
jgi:hypothetical protein